MHFRPNTLAMELWKDPRVITAIIFWLRLRLPDFPEQPEIICVQVLWFTRTPFLFSRRVGNKVLSSTALDEELDIDYDFNHFQLIRGF